jgi:hypothetical protein
VSDVSQPITGHCLCGAVSYTVDAQPIVSGVCHCTDCQRQTGSPFTVFVGVPEAAFEISGESLSSYTTVGSDHGGETERFFCTACGSPVYSLSPQAPGIMLLKAGSIDDSSWLEPAMELYLDSALPWSPRFEAPAQFERGPQPA